MGGLVCLSRHCNICSRQAALYCTIITFITLQLGSSCIACRDVHVTVAIFCADMMVYSEVGVISTRTVRVSFADLVCFQFRKQQLTCYIETHSTTALNCAKAA